MDNNNLYAPFKKNLKVFNRYQNFFYNAKVSSDEARETDNNVRPAV